MNDEKRLDDEALEKVSGGGDDQDYMNRIVRFVQENCYSCYRNFFGTCPYGSNEDAFKELGSNPYAKCPCKEAW